MHHTGSPSHRTVSVAYVRVLLSYLRSIGVPTAQLYDEQALARFDQADTLSRYDLVEWRAALHRAQACTGEADLIPALARHFQPWHAGVIGLTIMTSRTILHLGQELARFHHLLNDAFRVEIGIEGERFYLRLEPLTPDIPADIARLSLTSLVQMLRALTGRHDLQFEGQFTGSAPPDCTPYKHAFGGEVRFNQTDNAMWGPVPYVDLPLIPQDASVHSLLHDQAREQLAAVAQGTSRFIAKIEGLLRKRLSHSEVTLEMLAADLQMPPRTLQRRLDGLDLSFRKLAERVRKTQAIAYLQDTRMPLADIASALGFANQGTFHRAFKRWTGRAPGEFRSGLKRLPEQDEAHADLQDQASASA